MDWWPWLPSGFKCDLNKDHECRTIFCDLHGNSGPWICWSEFTAVFLQRIRWVASLGYPTLGKDYRANKPVSILGHKMALHWRPHRRDEKYNLKKGSQFLSQSSHTLTGATEAILFPLKSSYFFEGCATMLTVLIISRLATIAKTQQRKNVPCTNFYFTQSYSNF